ncbi:monoacylglycerol lipase-like [Salvia divinorum]|uniref:Monoacylglycerol lipase-like n=1 Tax=Salvia divinorum TaxID=28513 RepID=A0ABD1IF56_SALDI
MICSEFPKPRISIPNERVPDQNNPTLKFNKAPLITMKNCYPKTAGDDIRENRNGDEGERRSHRNADIRREREDQRSAVSARAEERVAADQRAFPYPPPAVPREEAVRRGGVSGERRREGGEGAGGDGADDERGGGC